MSIHLNSSPCNFGILYSEFAAHSVLIYRNMDRSHRYHRILDTLKKSRKGKSNDKYSRISMARTPSGPLKLVRDRGSSSQRGLIIAPGQGANKRYLFDILEREGILCVLIRIALLRRF